jgi:hypothetical protein
MTAGLGTSPSTESDGSLGRRDRINWLRMTLCVDVCSDTISLINAATNQARCKITKTAPGSAHRGLA